MYDVDYIDTFFDFTSDSPHYWDSFWVNYNGLGKGGSDPDSASRTLQSYHRLLWGKQLPNGRCMELNCGSGSKYLTWEEFRFGSDSITTSFRYERYRNMLEQIKASRPDYCSFIEDFLRKVYTIGGMIIFPKRRGGINQMRGLNPYIKDRWDLTLECIRRYYQNEKSPLYNTLLKEKAFFDLFGDFRGYIEFFYLQDCVSEDYQTVDFWIGNGEFNINPLPKTVGEYFKWIENQIEFVEKRNKRIANRGEKT